MSKSESIVNISKALLAAQKNMGDATKESKNPFYKSSYADLNSIREVVTPALNAEGISILQPTRVGADGVSYVETTLLHSTGEYLTSQFPIVAAKANDPQAYGSAVSYARRYSLQSFLSVGAVDDDAEAGMGRKTSAPTKFTPPVADKIVEKVVESSAPKKVSFSKKAVTPAVDTGDDI